MAKRKPVLPEMQTVSIPEATGYGYGRSAYEVQLSPRTVRFANGDFSFSSQSGAINYLNEHGLSIPPFSILYHIFSSQGLDSPFFDDIAGKCPKPVENYQEVTGTKLVAPKGWKDGKQDSDGTYPRIVCEYHYGSGWIKVAEQKLPRMLKNSALGSLALETTPVTGLTLRLFKNAPGTRKDELEKFNIHWNFFPALDESAITIYHPDRCFHSAPCLYICSDMMPDEGGFGFRVMKGTPAKTRKMPKTYEEGERDGFEKGVKSILGDINMIPLPTVLEKYKGYLP
jgi:hypothetical protein